MSCMVRTKACKRCGGDLSLESDRYGTYAQCIQCGAVWNVSEMISRESKPKNQTKILAAVK